MAEFFLGDQSEYERLIQREKDINNAEEGQEFQARSSSGRITEDDDIELSDEILRKLKRTRIINKDLYDVYMVPDPDYYDAYYNDPNGVDSNPILAKARSIKRVYKTYPEYLAAVDIRNDYMEYLVDKYGGHERYIMMKRAGMVKDWMPPNPIYSKLAYDRHRVESGTFICPEEIIVDNDMLEEWIDEKVDSLHTNPVDLEVKFDIITDIPKYNIDYLKYGSSKKSFEERKRVLNVADTDALNQIVRSWYVDDSGDDKEDDSLGVFGMSPENIRKRFFKSIQVGDPKLYELIKEKGEDAFDDYDPNELVVDDATGRTMKASELERRKVIRSLAKHGWDEIALLRKSGDISKYELSMMKRAKKNRKQARTLASNAASELLGVDAMSLMQDTGYDVYGPDLTASLFRNGGDY